jgi:hypothetical protein
MGDFFNDMNRNLIKGAGLVLILLLLVFLAMRVVNGGKNNPMSDAKISISPSYQTNAQSEISVVSNQLVNISPSALRQIATLESEKDHRTSAQLKMDSQLLYASRMARGIPVADGIPNQLVDLDMDGQGRVLIDIRANVSPELLGNINALHGNIINSFPLSHSIRAALPITEIESLASKNEVTFIEPAVRMIQNYIDSQGDFAHLATNARAAFGIDGANVKVGVISDSVDYLTNSQVEQYVTVLPGKSGIPANGEGTAMLELVHDLAPGSPLYFATAGGGTASMVGTIQSLQSAGCKIIVDDTLYVNESPFQDAAIAQAVNSVTAAGTLYFSSAGNSANKDHSLSGTWEGDFADGGLALGFGEAGRLHSFGTLNYDTVTTGFGSLRLDLFWSDPLGASTNDYDVFVLNSTGSTVVASSTNPQNGTQDPYESLGSLSPGQLIVILKKSGAARFLHLETGRGRLNISTSGNTRGHSCTTNAFCIAAVDSAHAGGGTNAFTGGSGNTVEPYSSDGPRRVFYQADGTAITPGNFSSSGGSVRQKPDLAAADNVYTDLTNSIFFRPFTGTSAAAPHAAAIAALLESYNSSLTPGQIRSILTTNALDIEALGTDRDSGYGIVMALPSLLAAPRPPLYLQATRTNNNQLALSFTAILGKTYAVQYSSSVAPTSWSTLTNITPSTPATTIFDSLTNAERFYRVLTSTN